MTGLRRRFLSGSQTRWSSSGQLNSVERPMEAASGRQQQLTTFGLELSGKPAGQPS